MEVVKELPEYVALSERLRERAPFFIRITSLGQAYYIAATPNVRALLELDVNGKDTPRDRRLTWDRSRKADALRDIVASLELQVRDVVLAGVESNVTDALLERLEEALRPAVRGEISREALLLLGPGEPDAALKNTPK